MNETHPTRSTFYLGEFLYAVSLSLVVLFLFGTLEHRDAASRAKSSRQLKAWRQHEATIADQIAATASIMKQERQRQKPIFEILPNLTYCRSGKYLGDPGWKYELKITSPTNVLVSVDASATIVEGVLTPITISSADGVEDKRIVALLAKVYSELGWEYNVEMSYQ